MDRLGFGRKDRMGLGWVGGEEQAGTKTGDKQGEIGSN